MSNEPLQPTARQVTMTLAAIAATAATPRPSGETLAQQSNRTSLGILQRLADSSLATQGTWTLQWVGLSVDNANMAYLAANTDGSNEFAVVIRGTVGNVADLLEDLGVGTMVPFTAVESPPRPVPVSVSKGAMEAFTQVIAMEPGGVSLVQALAGVLRQARPDPTVYVTGHSLGGCIATMVAPYLQAQTWPGTTPRFALHTFAAPSAGGPDFASYVDSVDWVANERCFNVWDLVPQAWTDLDCARENYYPDPPGPAANLEVKGVISAIAGLPGPNVYAQPGDAFSLNHDYKGGAYDPSVVKKSLEDFMGQVAFQHANSTYLGLLGTPDIPPGPVVTTISPGAGAEGTTITITGSGFGTGTVVDFGTVPCPRFSVNDDGTEITAHAPRGVGVVAVRVTTDLGTSPAVPFGQFAYGGPAPVVVTGISPDSGSAGTPVTITGVNFSSGVPCTPPPKVYFGDVAARPVQFTPPAQIVVPAPGHSGVGKPSTVNVSVFANGYSSPATPANEFTYKKLASDQRL
ncbi:IPT/TIG domain-containing protein [Actinomadura graeca]|uniref:IPT/TIG domain-containing protein n=1 Tax=Actinomadura graeca TaxID=2750812 RepID=A0ABX8R1X6_9ACTN|nr:IPT/TIG domain-containing protein [Actinomadura graeca]QXJ25050.1 IPT/TIG domain-containing protein [Actinomadura graeca]